MTINNEIKEPPCSIEVSKLLHKHGYKHHDWEREDSENPLWAFNHSATPNRYMLTDNRTLNYDHNAYQYSYVSKPTYDAPTHAVAIAWIRVNFNHHIWVQSEMVSGQAAMGYRYVINGIEDFNVYDTHEQAVEAALLYVLKKLIP